MTRPRPIVAATEAEAPPPAPGEAPAPADAAGPQPPSPAGERPVPPMAALLGLDPSSATDEQIQELVNRQVALDVENSGLAATHTVVLLHDDHSLTRFAADRIYAHVARAEPGKPILLILNSAGGDVAAAYMIAKLCREHTTSTFEVAVPRRAKSAATLICCAADRIHMGSLSELGPIDPQFGAIPALALKHSVEHLAELVGTYPSASGMFSEYLAKSLRVEALGYYERVAESAAQYATRLLAARQSASTDRRRSNIARRLVYSYKDHGFVIDAREAAEIFGQDVVVSNSAAYRLSNEVFGTLDLAGWLCGKRHSKEFSFIGAPDKGCMVWEKS